MPFPLGTTLRDLLTGAVPHHSAALALVSGTIPAGQPYPAGALPIINAPAPARSEWPALHLMFPGLVPGGPNFLTGTTREFRFKNDTAGTINVAGVLLLAYEDPWTPHVLVCVPWPVQWGPGRTLGGRLTLTSRIYG